MFNSIPVSQIAPDALTELLFFLPQEPQILSSSVSEYISSYDDDEQASIKIVNASRFLDCYSFISKLSHGFSTKIGRGGVALSASEKRKLSLAQCYYTNPSVIVLDEPTIHLDDESVKTLFNYLSEKKSQGAAIVLVTNDIRLQSLVDYSIELKEGKIIRALDHSRTKEKKHAPSVLEQVNNAAS